MYLLQCFFLIAKTQWSSHLKRVSVHHFLTFLRLAQILNLLMLGLFQPVLLGNYS